MRAVTIAAASSGRDGGHAGRGAVAAGGAASAGAAAGTPTIPAVKNTGRVHSSLRVHGFGIALLNHHPATGDEPLLDIDQRPFRGGIGDSTLTCLYSE
jgi:hypothetical protein